MKIRRRGIPFAPGPGGRALTAALLVSLAAGCATPNGPIGGTQASHQAATGAAIGAVAGNVLGYMTDSDRTTSTVLGALVGGSIGYWRGLQADRQLQQAQAAARDIARVQQSQTQYRYDEPRLYARGTMRDGGKVATFDKLETSIPYEAVRHRSQDAASVLRKLGALAARSGSAVSVYGPTWAARNYMISQLRRGAGAAKLTITGSYRKQTKVVLERIPPS